MKTIWILICSVLLVACGQERAASEPDMARAAAPMAKMAADNVLGGAEQSMTELSEPTAGQQQARKYIALRHHLNVELPANTLQAGFDAALKHCEALSCQVLSANFNKETPYNPPSASLSVRLPPRNVEVFLSGLEKSGDIIQHARDAEDKTNQVVDADARIKNLTELRDRLRQMLGDKSAKFKDIIDVERELANTQSQLDSIMSIRKVLSLETDLVAVNIDFSAKQGITEQGFFSPVARALKDAGRVMMESLAALITFVMSALPWLIIGIPLLLLIVKLWKKVKVKLLRNDRN
ncbi:DUF4349 domain-containing protein [Methylotenera sp. 1P/1]|jgi:hypothetical protein|uniref:DUF4349 domain-containing protein n=1 Tax=Methylotenera sp. 1P/1 TaxID=1131551 RepID=UPI00036AC188|nr:DUF4349 domain-containing protein [Methylotenera sp. 1P/1]